MRHPRLVWALAVAPTRTIASRRTSRPHRPMSWSPCYGMNDGNDHPFEEERFLRYRQGVRLLLARVRDEAKARSTIMTPPPYDPYRRHVGDRKAKTHGYKFPAVDHDETLAPHSSWLLALRDEGLLVADARALWTAICGGSGSAR